MHSGQTHFHVSDREQQFSIFHGSLLTYGLSIANGHERIGFI